MTSGGVGEIRIFESEVPKICVFWGGQLQVVGDFDFDLCFSFVQLLRSVTTCKDIVSVAAVP